MYIKGNKMGNDYNFLNVMRDHLLKINKLIEPTQIKLNRCTGKQITFSIHIKYMIYAMLSNQEKWSNIERYLPEIDKVFFNYDIEKIKEKSWEYFYKNIKPFPIRALSLKKQMKCLNKNIEVMESINNKYNGGIDAYILSKPPREIVKKFIMEYKLPNMGVSLVCEYLKSVGVECIKPDTHVMRFLSKTRRGYLSKEETYIVKKGKKEGKLNETNWNDNDKIKVLEIIENIGNSCEKTASDIDRIIWSYCAVGYGEICTKSPKCHLCVIRDGCNHNS